MPYSGDSANRAFLAALLASIAVHAGLLLLEWPRFAAALRQPVEALAPLVARLVEPAPPAPKLEPPKPEPPKPKPEPRPKAESKPALVAPPKPQPRPVPRADPVPKVFEPPAPAPAPAPAAEPVAPRAPAAPAVTDVRTLIAGYRAALLVEAARYKRYPPMARDNGWEGEVVVRMAIGADGAVVSLAVTSSSGYRDLDRQPLEKFRRAGPRVPVPEALRGKSFTLDLRAIYNLKDQVSG